MPALRQAHRGYQQRRRQHFILLTIQGARAAGLPSLSSIPIVPVLTKAKESVEASLAERFSKPDNIMLRDKIAFVLGVVNVA